MLYRRAIHVSNGRLEGKPDLVPNHHIARRLTGLGQVTALEITEIADVVDRSVAAHDLERRLARPWQRSALREQRIENDAATGLGLAPHAEVARKAFPQNITGLSIGLYGQPDCGCRPGIGGANHAVAECLLQPTKDHVQFAAAAGYIQGFWLTVRRKQLPHNLNALLHQRAASFVIVCYRNRHAGPAFAD